MKIYTILIHNKVKSSGAQLKVYALSGEQAKQVAAQEFLMQQGYDVKIEKVEETK